MGDERTGSELVPIIIHTNRYTHISTKANIIKKVTVPFAAKMTALPISN